jgi:hypothetical protein
MVLELPATEDNEMISPVAANHDDQSSLISEDTSVAVTPVNVGNCPSAKKTSAYVASGAATLFYLVLLVVEMYHLKNGSTLLHCANNGHEDMLQDEVNHYVNDANHWGFGIASFAMFIISALSLLHNKYYLGCEATSAPLSKTGNAFAINTVAHLGMGFFYMATSMALESACHDQDCLPVSGKLEFAKALGKWAIAIHGSDLVATGAATILSAYTCSRVHKTEETDPEAHPPVAHENTQLNTRAVTNYRSH